MLALGSNLHGWCAMALINLILGLLRSRTAHAGAWLLALAFPFTNSIVFPVYAFSFDIHVVSFFGIPIGLAAWFVGWRLRGRNYGRALELRPKWLHNSLTVAVWILVGVLGSWGWTMLVEWRSKTETLLDILQR
jgi:hypothetical protein